jgi:hypothetical protein
MNGTAVHGITADTGDRLFLDAGAVYINYGTATERLLGATRGGNGFNLDRKFRVMDADGAKGPVKGMRRLESVNAVITAKMLELTVENMLLAITGATGATEGTTTAITGGEVTDADYLTNVAIVGRISGKTVPVICMVKNALVDSGLDLKTADKDEAVVEVTFTAHYDPADMDEEPWEIIYPDVLPGSGS